MFELHITCSKDISKLKIDFTDGSCICTEDTKEPKKKEQKPPKESKGHRESREPKEQTLDTESTENSVPDWIIPDRPKKVEGQKPPEIPDLDRPPKIDEVLNNLDF